MLDLSGAEVSLSLEAVHETLASHDGKIRRMRVLNGTEGSWRLAAVYKTVASHDGELRRKMRKTVKR